jgi:hypothetical protein
MAENCRGLSGYNARSARIARPIWPEVRFWDTGSQWRQVGSNMKRFCYHQISLC